MSVDEVLAAIAEPMRRQLLDILADKGEASATVLAVHVPVSRQGVLKHLAILDAAGLVTSRRNGREVLYAVSSPQLTATARWMADLAAQWDRRLSGLKRRAQG
jgi:DNA-binding transcriptional ArsR family regulator